MPYLEIVKWDCTKVIASLDNILWHVYRSSKVFFNQPFICHCTLHRRITIQYLMSHFIIFGYLTCPYTAVWYYPILTSQLNVFPSINVLVASRLVKANNPDRVVTIHKKGEGLLNIISLIGSCSVSRLAFLHFLIWLLLHISISTIDSTHAICQSNEHKYIKNAHKRNSSRQTNFNSFSLIAMGFYII